MSDGGGLTALAAGAAELLKLFPTLYDDLLRPGVKQAGTALETVIGLGNTALWPIALANGRARMALESKMRLYQQKMAELKVEDVVAVSPEVGVPVLEKLTYVSDPTLSELYLNLLRSASTRDGVQFAHPSFVNVIANMAPDEARLLETYRFKVQWAMCIVYRTNLVKNVEQHSSFGLLDVAPDIRLDHPSNAFAYANNLVGLGLLLQDRVRTTGYPNTYMGLKQRFLADVQRASGLDFGPYQANFLHTDDGIFELTALGRMFLNACFEHVEQSSN